MRRALAACAAAGLLAACSGTTSLAPAGALGLGSVRTGDVVVIRCRTWRGQAVLAGGAVYSHCGIAEAGVGGPWLLHLSPAKDSGRVRLREVLAGADVEGAALLRGPQGSAGAADAAGRLLEEGVPFDEDFDHATDGAMYCSEFVEKSFRRAGLELFDGPAPLQWVALLRRRVLKPDALAEASRLELAGELATGR